MSAIESIQQRFFEFAPDLLCVAGMDGRFRRLNPTWTRVLGWSEGELLARPWLEHVHPDDRAATEAIAGNLTRGEPIIGFINRFHHRDGGWRWLSWDAHVLPDDGGTILAVARDVTETEALRAERDAARRQFEAMVANAPLGLFLWRLRSDGHLVLALANPAADRYTGIPCQALLGKTIEEAFPEVAARGIADRYAAVARGDEPPFQLHGLPYREGSIDGHFDVWAFQAGEGEVAACFFEVTERIAQERALLASREDLRITLDSIGDGVIASDREGRITGINRVASELTGWGVAEAKGRAVQEVVAVVHAGTDDPVDDPVGRVLSGGRAELPANHRELVRPDGRRVPVALNASPIRAADGAISGVVLVLRDVSAEHVLQRQLHHAQKLDAVGKLAGGIAHDFNNLLAGVVGACELLAVRLPEGDPDRRWVDLIDGAAARAAELTRKLLAFGRRTPDQALPVELGSVVRQVAGLLERTLERSIALQVEEPRSPLWLRGDPSQLQSALLNLCLNARDAMPGGGTLRLSLADAAPAPPGDAVLLGQMPDGCRAMLSVTDTGHGIEEHLLERIFEPFFTTKPAGRGSGLGLASVYAAAKAHGGAIAVRSKPGAGARFDLFLPLDPTLAGSAVRPSGSTIPAVGRRRRILVVDDEEPIRSAVAAWLEQSGHQALTAADGDAAIAALAVEPHPDLVLLDLAMPGRSGIETFSILRERVPGLPVLLMSGYNPHAADDLLAAGACGFLQKPFRAADLAGAIAALP